MTIIQRGCAVLEPARAALQLAQTVAELPCTGVRFTQLRGDGLATILELLERAADLCAAVGHSSGTIGGLLSTVGKLVSCRIGLINAVEKLTHLRQLVDTGDSLNRGQLTFHLIEPSRELSIALRQFGVTVGNLLSTAHKFRRFLVGKT